MRVLLIAVGSRGDSEPMCSLAAELATRKEIASIELFLQTDAESLVPKNNDDERNKIHYHELPFTQMDFYKWAGQKREPPQAGAGHPNQRVQFLGIVTDIMGELVLPNYSRVMETIVSEGPKVDVIVASSLARQLALEVATQVESSSSKPVPVYLVQLQNLVPTKDYPHYSRTEACVDALTGKAGANTDENRNSFVELERLQLEFLTAHVDPVLSKLPNYKKKEKGIDFDNDMLPILTGNEPADASLDVWMVNAVSTHIIPATSDAGPKVINVGSLSCNYIPDGFEPPQDLVSFLEKHADNPPVCFGYGSMPFGQAQMIVEAAFETKRPSILIGSAMMGILASLQESAVSEEDNEKVSWLKENIHCVSNIPYPWLLPKCAMMFCHGGAGTTQSVLRAGIPAVISPLIGDQFFFAKYLEAKGWGVACSDSLTALSKEAILASFEKAEACQPACKVLGAAMSSGEPASSNSGKYGPELLATAMVEHVSA
ncbi:Sterol 3-beta-glucosyltransferase [Seminavis robusta]|uniref:Sterol 3-beta-glucosyltransferase n=1 Tax=Seminavis robusta TaxID=568900 RepID=A0A9N8DCB0_9STRA|nr:Sterol 3-beta-glucosyltransferase [Seminavis robusta]|eukprot:Sro27_g018130.1 Sterol 3-beta-glucosyltransferase (487) ;mRNA; r:45993-47453